MRFADRADAGRRLAERLAAYRDRDPLILALPRGGLPVAAEIAAKLQAPLDVVVARKIGVPGQPELAMGALVDLDAPIVVRNAPVIRAARIDAKTFESARLRALAELEAARRRLVGVRPRAEIAGRVVILVDDGVATGATARAALQALRQRHPQCLTLAVPVAPAEVAAALSREVDDFVCLETPTRFGAVSGFYVRFAQVDDDEAAAILARFPPRPAAVDMR